jgi:hypothetical protein
MAGKTGSAEEASALSFAGDALAGGFPLRAPGFRFVPVLSRAADLSGLSRLPPFMRLLSPLGRFRCNDLYHPT